MVDVLIADDHPVVRRGLIQILEDSQGCRVIGEASNGDELLELARNTPADVALVDIAMPGPGVFDLLRSLAGVGGGLPTLILSIYPEDQFAVQVLRAGAAGYLTKDHSPSELVDAVHRVASGGRYVSADLGERLVRELQTGSGGLPHERLSDREFEVLRLLSQGSSVTQIAGQLVLSPKTVSTYRVRIMEKTGLGSTAEIIRYGVENGLVD